MATSFVALAVDGSVTASADVTSKALLAAATGAMRDEARATKTPLRADILAGLPGATKLANTWRVTPYPATGLANEPALQITNNAADLIEVFSEGATITAKGGTWLAIPSPDSLKLFRRLTPRGSDGTFQERGAWPQAVAAELGGKPQFAIEASGRRGLVYVQLKSGRRIIGWLVKQAVLAKRIRGTELLEEITAMLPANYMARFNAYLDAELKAGA